jgi:hypothetical protein
MDAYFLENGLKMDTFFKMDGKWTGKNGLKWSHICFQNGRFNPKWTFSKVNWKCSHVCLTLLITFYPQWTVIYCIQMDVLLIF